MVYDNRVIHKVKKRQNQYPSEFGHKQGEIFKKPAKEYIRKKERQDETQRKFQNG
jgi:hypothetical protein